MKDISELLDIVRAEFSSSGDSVEFVPEGKFIQIMQRTMDDPSRPSKSWQPVNIGLHEDFSSSPFAHLPTSEIRREFITFIRKKRAQFQPRTTSDPFEPHTAECWIFPAEC